MKGQVLTEGKAIPRVGAAGEGPDGPQPVTCPSPCHIWVSTRMGTGTSSRAGDQHSTTGKC